MTITRTTNKSRKTPLPTQERLREIYWDIGTHFPAGFTGDHVALAMIRPHHGYLHWNVTQRAADQLAKELGDSFAGARPVVRVYDVTDIMFDGSNAHMFFDIEVGQLSGKRYLHVEQLERNLLTEVGFLLSSGAFHGQARSGTVVFDRDRPSSRFEMAAMYVDRNFRRVLPVENLIDAPVYERLNHELSTFHRPEPLGVAQVAVDPDPASPAGRNVLNAMRPALDRCRKFGVRFIQLYQPPPEPQPNAPEQLAQRSEQLFEQLRTHHERQPLDLLHCHNWGAVPVALRALEELSLPFVLTLHSTEHERFHASETDEHSSRVCEWERQGAQRAALVIVPHSSTRSQVTTLYDAPPDRVTIIEHHYRDESPSSIDPAEAKRSIGLNPDWPVVLFAGEISHATGADLLMDALINVCREHSLVQFAFVGDGPLRDEIEGRAWNAGLGHRCRFLGDVPSHRFDDLVMGCDSVCIPARTWQDEGLAQKALAYGKPVLTTHQSQIHCIQHGQNGLVTYDNPGSIIWGLKELLANPLRGNMIHHLSHPRSDQGASLETVAAEHYLAYEKALADTRGATS